MKIYAIIVTYNRLNLLIKTISALKDQTFKIDKIVIINNGSTDGTTKWLLENNLDLEIIQQTNIGGAGGFHTGIKYAYEKGADWIWVMDDDVFPKNNALEKLIEYSSISEMIMPTRFFSDEKIVNWGYIFELEKLHIVSGSKVIEQSKDKKFNFINTACFEGMLVARNLIDKIGFPDPRFFIAGDDTAYGLLASRYTNLIIIKEAILIRAKTFSQNKIKSSLFTYYYFRNFHLLQELYCNIYNKKRFPLYVYLKRSYMFLPFIKEVFQYQRKDFFIILNQILRGYYHSILKKTGNTF
jgi:rhamnopyranosyl-N-acetylglucosaminyl-diphospho-decaprenol beta-1,3/1,4-galactofuranosyltransferase